MYSGFAAPAVEVHYSVAARGPRPTFYRYPDPFLLIQNICFKIKCIICTGIFKEDAGGQAEGGPCTQSSAECRRPSLVSAEGLFSCIPLLASKLSHVSVFRRHKSLQLLGCQDFSGESWRHYYWGLGSHVLALRPRIPTPQKLDLQTSTVSQLEHFIAEYVQTGGEEVNFARSREVYRVVRMLPSPPLLLVARGRIPVHRNEPGVCPKHTRPCQNGWSWLCVFLVHQMHPVSRVTRKCANIPAARA